jgi:hypothetical protein
MNDYLAVDLGFASSGQPLLKIERDHHNGLEKKPEQHNARRHSIMHC